MSLITPSAYVEVVNVAIHLSVRFISESAGRISMGSDTGQQHSAGTVNFILH